MSRKLFGLALFTLALVFVLSAAPASAGQEAIAPALETLSPAPVPCGGALSNLTAPVENLSPAAQPAGTVPDFLVQPAARLGYCHCGCSSVRSCRTSADCGGASCDQVISCC
jgi:hypothetical protein